MLPFRYVVKTLVDRNIVGSVRMIATKLDDELAVHRRNSSIILNMGLELLCLLLASQQPFLIFGFLHRQINVANVDPTTGTYSQGDFKTVALAGYIRAKVSLHKGLESGAVDALVGKGRRSRGWSSAVCFSYPDDPFHPFLVPTQTGRC